MKTLWRAILCATVLLVGTASCDKVDENLEEGANVGVKVGNPVPGPNNVTIEMELTGITDYSYNCYSAAKAPANAPSALMMFGPDAKNIVSCSDAVQTLTIDGLLPVTDYVLYIAFRAGTDLCGDVQKITFKTLEIDSDFLLMGVSNEGYTIRMRLPDSVRENGNVIRYTSTSRLVYNENKYAGISDMSMLSFNGMRWFGELNSSDPLHNKDILIYEMNRNNCYERDENNDIVYENGEPVMVADMVVPGEPTVFIAGEFANDDNSNWGRWQEALFDSEAFKGDDGGDDDEIDGDFGVGGIPTFGALDFETEDACWTGYHIRQFFESRKPEVLDVKLDVTIPKETIGAIDATIIVEPDNEISEFCIYVIDKNTYMMSLLPLLDGRPELMQWYTTSAYAFQYGSRTFRRPDNGEWQPVKIKMSDGYYVSQETTYNVYVVGVSDQTLLYQCYKTANFQTKKKSHPKPVVVVTPIDNPNGPDPYKDPLEVWYNVKCTTQNAVSGGYACNDTDTWVKMVNSGYSNSTLINSSNGIFTATDLEKMNSPEGLNMNFATTEGSTMRLGVLVFNDEDTPNDVDLRTDNTAIADASTGYLPDGERIESEYFTDLEGEWTLTARAGKRVSSTVNGEAAYEWDEQTIESKIVIASSVSYPEISDEVYAAYHNKPREDVEKLYNDFKDNVDVYNRRLRARNRILMFGFNDSYNSSWTQNLWPYDLFIHDKYNAFNNSVILRDFGPKWYLEVSKDENGNIVVTAPFNSETLPPMSQCGTYPMTFAAAHHYGVDKDGKMSVTYLSAGLNGETLHFPVEISDDMQTITIKPYTLYDEAEEKDVEYYPNVIYQDRGRVAVMYPVYTSELVLRRGWTETAPAAVPSGSYSAHGVVSGTNLEPAASSCWDITSFDNIRKVEYREEEYRLPDPASFGKNRRMPVRREGLTYYYE